MWQSGPSGHAPTNSNKKQNEPSNAINMTNYNPEDQPRYMKKVSICTDVLACYIAFCANQTSNLIIWFEIKVRTGVQELARELESQFLRECTFQPKITRSAALARVRAITTSPLTFNQTYSRALTFVSSHCVRT